MNTMSLQTISYTTCDNYLNLIIFKLKLKRRYGFFFELSFLMDMFSAHNNMWGICGKVGKKSMDLTCDDNQLGGNNNMNDFLNRLKDKCISFEYFGDGDIATGVELKTIIENEDYFNQLYEEFSLVGISSFEDYCVYLIYCKFALYKGMVPMLAKDEYKDIINRFSDNAKEKVEGISNGDIIRFINAHVADIFEAELEVIGIKHVTLDLIAKYKNGISEEVYTWLCNKYDYMLLNRFDSFESIFEKYPSLFDGIFPTGKYQEINSLREETTFTIFSRIYQKGSSPLKQTVDRVVGVLAKDILEMCENANENKVMLVDRTFRRFYSCLVKMKSPIANTFVPVKKKLEALLNESVKKNGIEFKYEIPTGKIVEQWKKQENWEVRMIALTHVGEVDKSGNITFHSRIEVQGDSEKSLMDMVSTNMSKDEYYTLSLQEKLSIIRAIESGTFQTLMYDRENYVELLNMIMSVMMFINEQFGCDEERLDLDVKILDSHLQMCMAEADVARETDIALCYGASMFLCALIDNLMRILYVNIAGVDQYIAIDKLTIGQTLNPNDQIMKDYFGEKHLRHLAFFLSKDGIKERNIGFNYRNSLAHWTIDASAVTKGLVAQLLWLFVDVLNTIFIHLMKQEFKN